MNILLPIWISFIAGIFFLILPERIRGFTKVVSPLIGILSLVLSIILFFNWKIPSYISEYVLSDMLSKFIYLSIGFFGFIISLYSSGHITKNINRFFAYFFLTLGSAFAIAIADNLIILLSFWGFLGITLYLLIQHGKEGANEAAKKTLIIIGASDCFLIMGIGILWWLNSTFSITELSFSIGTNSPLLVFSFICFTIAAFAKAGNMPLHTWVPPCAATAPIPVTAFIPAALDKLLGIYLFARCVISIYIVSPGLSTAMMIFGAATIIFAVFMALVQHSGRKLLAYHAISQVGYMVLGIGTLNPIGIIGGIFHMLNNAIYKSCLFLGLGAVEKKTGTDNLDSLGGLTYKMPFTLFAMLIASLAISGIPPLNGFFSKWFIYQGVIETFKFRNPFIPAICLIAALFGSALTLASFTKLIHSIFLARRQSQEAHPVSPKISKFLIILPQLILALSCIIFGIFAYPLIINPVFKNILPVDAEGIWKPELATLLIIVGIALGLLIYVISRIKVRTTPAFIGGEKCTSDMRVSGADFYLTIEDIPLFGKFYKWAGEKFFDIYEIIKVWIFSVSKVLKFVHCGSLPFYLLWLLGGGTIIILLLW